MPESFTNGYALVVGVGADLDVTVDDATAVAAQLTDAQRCGYEPDHVRLLTEGGATRADVLAGLQWLADSTGSDDTAVVYFSGHGMETPGYYLMPNGYDTNALAETAISGDEFTTALRAINAGKLLVLLDCCHAGGMAEAKGVIKSPMPPGLADALQAGSGRVVVASSRRDEKSWTGTPYSVFTDALLEGLAGYGAFEPDGYARILDTVLWLGRKVPDRTHDKQHPIVKVSNLSDNFALAWYSGGAKSVVPLPHAGSDLPLVMSPATTAQQRTFQIHVGSTAWYDALKRDGMRVDVAPFLKNWSERAAVYQQQVKKYWLYP